MLFRSNGAPGERFVNFTLSLAVSTPWAHPGFEVCGSQFALNSKPLPKPKTSPSKEKFVNEQGLINLPFAQVAPRLTLWRAPNDNDRIGHIDLKWNEWGLRELIRSAVTTKHTGNRTTITSTWKTGAGISIKHIQIVESVVDGLRVSEKVTLPKALDDVARVGITFELNGELDQFSFFEIGRAHV